MPNQPPDAGRVGEQQVEGTSAFSPNPVPQLGGKPLESKQEVSQSSVTGMDSAEESPMYPVSSTRYHYIASVHWLILKGDDLSYLVMLPFHRNEVAT